MRQRINLYKDKDVESEWESDADEDPAKVKQEELVTEGKEPEPK